MELKIQLDCCLCNLEMHHPPLPFTQSAITSFIVGNGKVEVLGKTKGILLHGTHMSDVFRNLLTAETATPQN